MGVITNLTTKVRAHAAAATHRWPARQLQVVFVFGQDGGQLTAVALASILQQSGAKVGLITSGFLEIGGERASGSDQADPLGDPFRLHGLLAQMRRAKCTHVVIDLPATLPAHHFAGIAPLMVVQRRCGDRHFNEASNTARKNTWRRVLGWRPQFAVLNRDDPCYAKPHLREEQVMSFGTDDKAECRMADIAIHPKGSAVKLVIDHQTELQLVSGLTGKTAVYSLVAAAAAAYLLHVPIDTIEDGIRRLPPQPAALQFLPAQRPYQLVIDANVTPEGVVETLEMLKHFARNRLIAVLSANLAQPAAWRPIIGEQVVQLADRVIVTDGEFTSDESAQTIRQQLLQGMLGAEARTEEIAGRREALEKALGIVRRNDIIVVLASTVRPYRQTGSDRTTWNDAVELQELLGS